MRKSVVLMVGLLVLLVAGLALAATKLEVHDGSDATVFSVTDTGTTSTAQMGVGTSAPTSTMTVVDQTSAATRGLGVFQANTGTQAGVVDFRKMRGSYTATPSAANAVAYGDYVGAFHGWGVDSVGTWVRGATINYYVDNTVTAGQVPIALLFSTGSQDSQSLNPGLKLPRLAIGSDGKMAFGYGYVAGASPARAVMATTSGNNIIDMNSDAIRISLSRTPASSSATCYQGEIAWDASYIYVCITNNTWKRMALSAF